MGREYNWAAKGLYERAEHNEERKSGKKHDKVRIKDDIGLI